MSNVQRLTIAQLEKYLYTHLRQMQKEIFTKMYTPFLIGIN